MLSTIINVDLHIHSKISEYKEIPGLVDESDSQHLNVLLAALNKNGINFFAFSDHNRFDSDLFNKAKQIIDSENNPYPSIKNIVPSVEFDVQIDEGHEPCHILVIFNAKNNDDLLKISSVIMEKPLTRKEEFYNRTDFETLLKSIGLSTLLIACQRTSLDKKESKTNSLSGSCDDVYSFLSTGYIDALEYQKPNVQGILKDCFQNFPQNMGIGLVAGSDCHEWSSYPFHDKKSSNSNKSFFFSIKSLPTFMGLVLAFSSPKTRFCRKKYEPENWISCFELNGVSIPLSNGFNAIIGENGSGKSTILTGLALGEGVKTKYIKSLLTKNSFHVNALASGNEKIVAQNELSDNSYTKESIFGEEVKFPEVNLESFEKEIYSYKESLVGKLRANIAFGNSVKKLKTFSFKFNTEYEKSSSFFVHINVSDDFTSVENPAKARLQSINKIINELSDEYQNTFYLAEQKKFLKAAFTQLVALREGIVLSYKQKAAEIKAKNFLSVSVDDYNRKIKPFVTDEEQKISDYKKTKNDFASLVIEVASNLVSKENKKVSLGNITGGTNQLPLNGFNFISKAKFTEVDNLKEEILQSWFKKGYQKEKDILSIDSQETIEKALFHSSGQSGSTYETILTEDAKKFIDEYGEVSHSVLEVSTKEAMGNTMGEEAVVFFKFITSPKNRTPVYLIDQPEDNISNPRIISKLIESFDNLRDESQLIFVTHNPLLVVNLDVDNVVYLSKINDKINVKSGCLEDDGILDIVADNMDGGREVLKRRLKIYGE